MSDVWIRVRAHAGLWSLVALLGLGTVFLAAAAAPALTRVQDDALRKTVDAAPASFRDITFAWPHDAPQPESADATVARASALLTDPLSGDQDLAWGWQATLVSHGALRGGELPPTRAQLTHHTGLESEVALVAGDWPATGRPDTAGQPVVEVMASVAVAEDLGLVAGQEYGLAEVGGGGRELLRLRLAGVFTPADPAAPIWQPHQLLLRTGHSQLGGGDVVTVAALATDQAGIDLLRLHGPSPVESRARFRLDSGRLDVAWTGPAAAAVRQLRLGSTAAAAPRLETELETLLADFHQLAAVYRAVAAVMLTGIIGTGGGLLLLAGRLAAARRASELSLLRARGGSAATVALRLASEAMLVVGPAVLLGWLLATPVGNGLVPPIGWLPGMVAVAAVAVVPAAAAVTPVHPGNAPARTDLGRLRTTPARRTAEVCLVLLAGLGVLLVHLRGQAGTPTASLAPVDSLGLPAGADPYLSSVPVLVGLAAGLVALRAYAWPIRGLGQAYARSRGLVAFLGLARARRGAPVTALPVLVLVLAVAMGGYTSGVHASVAGLTGHEFHRALILVFVTGVAAAGVGGLLALGLALVSQAPARTRSVALLRTLGMPVGRARRLLLVEVLPLTAVAVAVGTATGAALPILLGPALDLTRLTGGDPVPLALNPAAAGLLAGGLLVAVTLGVLVTAPRTRVPRSGG